jgi:hypothetical protein
MQIGTKSIRLAMLGLVASGAIAAAGCGSAAHNSSGSASGTTHAAPAPQTTSVTGIPQNNGGDHDSDNNGGPSDGDGNI